MTATYPTQEEAAVVAAAEKLMVETMARYDPSHDAYHGPCRKVYAAQGHKIHLESDLLQSSASEGPRCSLPA